MTDFLASEISIQEEPPAVRQVPNLPTAVVGAVGVTQKGPVGQSVVSTSPDEWERVFGGHIATSDASLFVKTFFENGGTELHFVRTVHHTDATDPTTKTSAAATLTLNTAAIAASAAAVTSSNTGPWNLEPSDTLVVTIDGGSPATATFTATAAARESGSDTWNLDGGAVLTVEIDGGDEQTIEFVDGNFVDPTAATAAEVAAVINAQITGAQAEVTNTDRVTIRSDKRGTDSGVNVTGGTANAVLSFTTGNVAGTGNVANIDAVTFSEAKLVIEGAVTGCTVSNVGGAARISSNTTGGASSVLVGASSTADDEFGFDNATHTGSAGGAVGTLRVDAKYDGTYANSIRPIVEAPTSGESGRFNFKIESNGTVVERWPDASMNPSDARYIETLVNADGIGSTLVTVTDLEAAVDSPDDVPATGTFGPLTGGADGLSGLADTDFVGGAGANGDVGLRCLDGVQTLTLVAAPGRATASVHNGLITYCEIVREGLCFAVLDPPRNQTASQIVSYVRDTAAIQRLSEHAAIYWPNIVIDNPNKTVFGNSATIVAPPSGAICGLYTRVDASKPSGVFEHPAGVENGVLFNVRGLEMPEVKKIAKRKIVFPQLINPISTEPGQPIFVDGARTLKDNGSWPTIGERRGVIFLEASLKIALTFMRHRRITDRLYNEGKKTTLAFMLQQCNNEAFASTNPRDAFQVDFGKGLNPATAKHARQVYARVSVATAKPAEFIVLKVSPDQRALEAELAAIAA